MLTKDGCVTIDLSLVFAIFDFYLLSIESYLKVHILQSQHQVTLATVFLWVVLVCSITIGRVCGR